MAWDNFVCTYHLTPHGWKMADVAPANTVWIVSEKTYQRSGFSKEQITWDAQRPQGTIETVRTLLKKYPYPQGNPAATARTLQTLLERLSN